MNKDEKVQLIWDYIFGSGGKAEWKEKFEIAWDVSETFDDIREEIRKKVIEFLCEEIKKNPEFKGYKITDFGLIKGEKEKPLILYKPEWILNPSDKEPVLGYAIEAGQNDYYHLYYGIHKYDNDKGVPFKGKWEEADIPEEWKKIFAQMKGLLDNSWKSDDWWILWRNFDEPYSGMWQKEFYEEIIDKSNGSIEDGCREMAMDYVKSLLDLKRTTENLVDEFIEIYKKKGK